MIYLYKCTNEKCKQYDKETSITKPMMEASRTETCNKCRKELKRVYTASSIKTAGDGVKL